MAFGKDNNQKRDLPRFGSKEMREALSSTRRPQSTGTKFGPFFRAWVPPPGRVFGVILHSALHRNLVLQNGELVEQHMPYYRYGQHWVNNKRRFGICSAFPYSVAGKDYQTYANERCGGCAQFSEQWVQVKVGNETKWRNEGAVSKCSETFGFSATVLGPFYEVDSPKISPKTGKPYPEHVLDSDPRVQAAIKSGRLNQLLELPAQRFIWNLSRQDTTLLFGGEDLPEGSDVVDDQLSHQCQACMEPNSFVDGSDTCSNCGADESQRVGLFDRVLFLKASITGTPKKPGGRPPTALKLVTDPRKHPFGWAPIPEGLLGTEYLEPIPLAEKLYPLPPEQQMDLYGMAPKVTDQGETGLVDADPSEGDHSESGSADDDIPF